jgi:hypothetical protein
MGQLRYNLLFRWFVGLSLDDEIWDETVFTKNRERLIEGDIAKKFTAAVLDQKRSSPCSRTSIFRSSLPRRRPGHADRSVGQDEELSSQRRQRRAAGTGS